MALITGRRCAVEQREVSHQCGASPLVWTRLNTKGSSVSWRRSTETMGPVGTAATLLRGRSGGAAVDLRNLDDASGGGWRGGS